MKRVFRVAMLGMSFLSLYGMAPASAQKTPPPAGPATFADVPAGRYVIKATHPGFAPAESPPIVLRPGDTAQVLLEIHATLDVPPVEVRAPATATQSLQPVSTSDMLSGTVLDLAPL